MILHLALYTTLLLDRVHYVAGVGVFQTHNRFPGSTESNPGTLNGGEDRHMLKQKFRREIAEEDEELLRGQRLCDAGGDGDD